MMRFLPFQVPRCDCGDEVFSVPALSAPPNLPGLGRGTVCNKLRLNRQESRASRDGNSGDQDRAADRTATSGSQRSARDPGWRLIDRAQLDSGYAAIRGGQFLRSGATANPAKGEIPDSTECG